MSSARKHKGFFLNSAYIHPVHYLYCRSCQFMCDVVRIMHAIWCSYSVVF